MDGKIRHKLIEIKDRVSNRFVILVTKYRWLRILEVIRYRRSNGPILKNTRQIYKPEDQWSCKRSPDICILFQHYFSNLRPQASCL